MFLEKWNIKVDEVYDVWKSWSPEKQKAFLARYEDIAILLPIQVDKQLIKAIMPFWDPSYRCFAFNQEDMIPTVEEYKTLLRIETSNPNKVFWKKTKEVGFVKKMFQIIGIDVTIIGQMKSQKGKSMCLPWDFVKKFLAKCED